VVHAEVKRGLIFMRLMSISDLTLIAMAMLRENRVTIRPIRTQNTSVLFVTLHKRKAKKPCTVMPTKDIKKIEDGMLIGEDPSRARPFAKFVTNNQ